MISPGRGVKINYLFYWSEAMADPKVQRQQVPVRFDPFDLGTAYAFIGGQWVQCYSAYYGVFQGRSQKELQIISKELRAQNKERGPQFQISAARLAQAFQDVNSQESVFVQRLRASESQAVRERFVHSDSCQVQAGPLAGGADSVLCNDLIEKDTRTYGAF
jgi:putative transposase